MQDHHNNPLYITLTQELCDYPQVLKEAEGCNDDIEIRDPFEFNTRLTDTPKVVRKRVYKDKRYYRLFNS